MIRFIVACSIAFLFAGCATPLIVTSKRPVEKPFSRILAIYVDDPFEFSAFDSVTYDIGVRSCFRDSTDFPQRNRAETILYEQFDMTQTDVVKSADIFDKNLNSYDDFRKQLDSLEIDAILLVNLHGLNHSSGDNANNGGLAYSSAGGIPLGGGTVGKTYIGFNPFEHSDATDATFQCYLIRRNEFFPVWTASFGATRRGRNGTGSFAGKITKGMRVMTQKLADGGYIEGR